ncbi:Tetratricopeptide repeat-containing protein [Actinokineospora globicatena]|uniref:tetratricopeptide repeat protein n=1 Tax=Actinokineospora globicatena TaxID=103729 RepID=UPI0020A3F083|nr:tetratricopeptide repeat protein [Actinokineospora globicatena]MCP2302491.1 Tetratricopeptide repeat-containing protein [Actinokineospora globicatena]GLW82662.1 hypothetical protein Aglo02_03030 [Actinokineospora globicatena]
MVDRLLSGPTGHRRVLVATLRLQELHRLDTDTDSDRLTDETRRRVLAAVTTRIDLKRRFTPDELTRAHSLDADPRIAEALTRTDEYGLPEYLAAGPQLLDRWRNGTAPGTTPRGAALVTAAIECRRAGYSSPLPRALLEELHTDFLEPRSRPEDLDQAWTWATTPWRDTTALLEPVDDTHVTVFDYLVDHTQRTTPPGSPPSEKLILTALNHAPARDCAMLGGNATDTGRYQLAYTAYSRALTLYVDPDDPNTLSSRNNLANALDKMGRYNEAEVEHRIVLETRTRVLGPEHPGTLTSRNNLAQALAEMGRYDEAEAENRAVLEAFTRVLGPEHPYTLTSRNNLVIALIELGRFSEAEAEL